MTLTVEVTDVTRCYGSLKAVDRLDIQVSEGEIFGLLGANGAGKTTLIKLIIGLLRPDAGRIRSLGLEPIRHARELRRQIGYMPQTPILYDDLTARENLLFWARAHHLPDLRTRVDETMSLVDLADRANTPVYSLSGGMKQRLSLACALVHRPRLLLLDEPTTGVDPKLRQTFWQTFRQMTAKGATILLSTHQMDEAIGCDRLAILRDGRLLASDTPKGLFARAQAQIAIDTGAGIDVHQVADYPSALPQLLRAFHLDGNVRRITVEREPLESIVLRLIDARSQESLP
ncbi:MAG: heme ABC exporter ATP-binding protein CcmA [Chloroflexi bacterium]|nr:heme ABC exporter ATP-binding protein CcmA [Chloroflexota bacterium]